MPVDVMQPGKFDMFAQCSRGRRKPSKLAKFQSPFLCYIVVTYNWVDGI
jgi:hypothetical protein